ncbi:hypothetical protein H2198_010941 [Neophaeococcomyces mojaviensis]|uniref:Uncharacterized protein n=1 Tax=Neophaeococcomyces mojaviensis TaxID=3383035 RepID=A0ACC2ZNN9_9EURO|nr:hypothetical protein H2198_010941 [Knufia sp. JES_112]
MGQWWVVGMMKALQVKQALTVHKGPPFTSQYDHLSHVTAVQPPNFPFWNGFDEAFHSFTDSANIGSHGSTIGFSESVNDVFNYNFVRAGQNESIVEAEALVQSGSLDLDEYPNISHEADDVYTLVNSNNPGSSIRPLLAGQAHASTLQTISGFQGYDPLPPYYVQSSVARQSNPVVSQIQGSLVEPYGDFAVCGPTRDNINALPRQQQLQPTFMPSGTRSTPTHSSTPFSQLDQQQTPSRNSGSPQDQFADEECMNINAANLTLKAPRTPKASRNSKVSSTGITRTFQSGVSKFHTGRVRKRFSVEERKQVAVTRAFGACLKCRLGHITVSIAPFAQSG